MGCKTTEKAALPCETMKHKLYQQDDVVYFGCTPIKIIPKTDFLLEIFLFDLSLPDGQKRLFWDTIPQNKHFQIDLHKMQLKAYWFGYRILGTDKIEMVQFELE